MSEGVVGPRPGRRLSPEGAVEWYAATTNDGAPCLLVKGARASSLVAFLRAHAELDVAEVPRVVASSLEAPAPWVALACDPIGTLEDLAAVWPKRSVPYAEGIVLTHTIARAFAAAHARGFTLGALAPSQLVVDRSGALRIVGFGFDEAAWGTRAFRSPLVAMGEPPSPASDVNTGLLFLRAHIHWVAEVPEALSRILKGDPGPLERAFARGLFGAFNHTMTIDGVAGLRVLERFWSLVGVEPNHRAFARRIRGTLVDDRVKLAVAKDASFYEVDGGARHDLLRREPVRKVLRALLSADGASLSIDDLVRIAWPGEALVGSSGADRVYVALSTLRKLDLRPALVRDAGGYALRASIAWVDS